jgi:alkylhydroperoxidase family enzyme
LPRIPYLQDDQIGPADLVAAIRQRRGGHLLNLDRLLLYSPHAAAGWNHLMGAVRAQLALEPKLSEMAMCAVATLNQAHYEFHHHAPELLKAGGTAEQVQALGDVAQALTRHDLFDRREMAVLRVAAHMTQGVQVPLDAMTELNLTLGDERLVFETVLTVAAYNMVSRIIVALGVEPEAHAQPAHLPPPTL